MIRYRSRRHQDCGDCRCDRSLEVVRSILVFLPILSLAAGAVFAQEPPTGVVRRGDIQLMRSSSKFSAPPFGILDTTTDTISGAFSMVDYGEPLGIDPPAVITIGSCIVVPIGGTVPIVSPSVTILDAGPVLNLTGPNGTTQIV